MQSTIKKNLTVQSKIFGGNLYGKYDFTKRFIINEFTQTAK